MAPLVEKYDFVYNNQVMATSEFASSAVKQLQTAQQSRTFSENILQCKLVDTTDYAQIAENDRELA